MTRSEFFQGKTNIQAPKANRTRNENFIPAGDRNRYNMNRPKMDLAPDQAKALYTSPEARWTFFQQHHWIPMIVPQWTFAQFCENNNIWLLST